MLNATEYKYIHGETEKGVEFQSSPLFLETAAAASFLDINKSTSDGKKCTPHRPRRKTPTRKEFAADLSSERKSSSTQSERERKKLAEQSLHGVAEVLITALTLCCTLGL
jgi:hypothetical protein